LLQGYGQTESGPVSNCNRPEGQKLHTVGPPLKDVKIKIAEDGEILIKGELVMNGYWGEPELTRVTLKGGWLHTGDIGKFDEEGHLQMTDRKKDIIVNAGGDNISPQRVEGFLTLQPEISQAMVYGDKQPHLVGLIVPDQEFARQWASEQGKDPNMEELVDDPKFRNAIFAAIERVNKRLSVIEHVRKFVLTAEPFSQDNDQLTPTLKIRRHEIVRQYGDQLESLYYVFRNTIFI